MIPNAQDQASFSGLLMRRHYRQGDKYVQLLFRTADGAQLALSRDAQLVTSLQVGRKYLVQGRAAEFDGKPYIDDPVITPLYSKRHFLKRNARLVGAGAVMAVMLVSGLAFSLRTQAEGKSDTTKASSAQKNTSASDTKEAGNVLGAAVEKKADDPVVPTPAPSPAVSKPKTTKTVSPTPAPVTNPTPSPTPSPEPTPSPTPSPSPTPTPTPTPEPSPLPVTPPPPAPPPEDPPT